MVTPATKPAPHLAEITEFSGNEAQVDALECALCKCSLGLVTGDGELPTRWFTYWAVWLDGDVDATVFCEDDVGWLMDVAPALMSPAGKSA